MGEKEGSREMQVSQTHSPGPASRPGTSVKGEKAGRRRVEPEDQRLLVHLGLPSPAKPLQQKLNTHSPSRCSSVESARRSLSPLAAGRRPAPPATSREESRRGGVRAPTHPTPSLRDSHAQCPRGQPPRPSWSGWGRTKRTSNAGAKRKNNTAGGE